VVKGHSGVAGLCSYPHIETVAKPIRGVDEDFHSWQPFYATLASLDDEQPIQMLDLRRCGRPGTINIQSSLMTMLQKDTALEVS
jgi:hypothetical protein